MKVKAVIAAVSAAALLAAGSQAMAFGGHKPHRDGMMGPRMSFEELDTNSDGKLSKEELQAKAQGPFGAADANGDGKITKEEALAAAQTRAGARFDKMLEAHDADEDGALTMEEIANGKREARMEKMFERVDADKDGFISKEEMEQMRGKGHGKRWMK